MTAGDSVGRRQGGFVKRVSAHRDLHRGLPLASATRARASGYACKTAGTYIHVVSLVARAAGEQPLAKAMLDSTLTEPCSWG